jgi:predicted HicB family RNase H-like nuclease
MNRDKPRSQSKFLLRLPKSVSDTAKQVAGQEGVSLNHFITLAVAEKIIRVEQSTSPTATPRSEREGRLPGPGLPAK